MEEKENIRVRFESLLLRTMDRMEAVMADEKQFRRHFVKSKGEGDIDQKERIYRKVDTKALKEFVAALGELKDLLGEEETVDTALRVVFEAGEEAFNE